MREVLWFQRGVFVAGWPESPENCARSAQLILLYYYSQATLKQLGVRLQIAARMPTALGEALSNSRRDRTLSSARNLIQLAAAFSPAGASTWKSFV
jgi:hypothetical protein